MQRGVTLTRTASAHHEALFGPQSSLAVESEGFVSLQSHAHAYGIHGTETQESTYILSAGLSPIGGVPWSIAIVQPFTYQTTASPTAPEAPGRSALATGACDARTTSSPLRTASTFTRCRRHGDATATSLS
jgi:hypothetical protein